MSKGLEALERLYLQVNPNMASEDKSLEYKNIIEKELKALEILKETLPAFVYAITNSKDYEDYSNHYISPIISKEQYDLLKEVFYET